MKNLMEYLREQSDGNESLFHYIRAKHPKFGSATFLEVTEYRSVVVSDIRVGRITVELTEHGNRGSVVAFAYVEEIDTLFIWEPRQSANEKFIERAKAFGWKTVSFRHPKAGQRWYLEAPGGTPFMDGKPVHPLETPDDNSQASVETEVGKISFVLTSLRAVPARESEERAWQDLPDAAGLLLWAAGQWE